MRRRDLLWAAVASLVIVVPGFSQQAGGFLNGVNTTQLNFQPIDTSRALRGATITGGLRTPSFAAPTGFGRLFPRISLGTWPPVLPFTPILKGASNPYQPTPIQGKNLFRPKQQ